VQKKTCGKSLHVKIDTVWEVPKIICGIFAVGGNFNLRYYKLAGQNLRPDFEGSRIFGKTCGPDFVGRGSVWLREARHGCL